MTGKYFHSLDAKGRLFVPSKLREELGDTFYVTLGLGGCLSVYPMSKWTQIEEHYKTLSLTEAARLRSFFANAAKCEPDKQGRFLLPAELRKYAHLEDDVAFLGVVDHAEIWNAAAYTEVDQVFMDSDDELATALEELHF